MAEYIDREALYEKAYWHGEHPDVGNPFPDGVDAIDIKDVDAIPAADVAPVRHARWEEADWVEPDCHGFGIIRTPKAALRCSNCKNCFKKELLWKDNYCPNCGTDMRGSNDE